MRMYSPVPEVLNALRKQHRALVDVSFEDSKSLVTDDSVAPI